MIPPDSKRFGQRRQLFRQLERKYGGDLAEVLGFAAAAGERLDVLARDEERALRLDEEIASARQALEAAESAVAVIRREAAPRLAAEIETTLRELAMPSARFSISVEGEGPADQVTFLLGANPGEPSQPLAKVASGGELARTMLAVRLAVGGSAGGHGVRRGRRRGGRGCSHRGREGPRRPRRPGPDPRCHPLGPSGGPGRSPDRSAQVRTGRPHPLGCRRPRCRGPGSWRSAACCRADRTAHRPSATPASCSTAWRPPGSGAEPGSESEDPHDGSSASATLDRCPTWMVTRFDSGISRRRARLPNRHATGHTRRSRQSQERDPVGAGPSSSSSLVACRPRSARASPRRHSAGCSSAAVSG